MPEHDMSTGKEGIGYPQTPPGGVSIRNLRIEMDAMLRRYGFPDGLAALDRIPGQGSSGAALADLVRPESHSRMSAPSRDAMRRSALAAASSGSGSGWTEQMISAFVAFCMKGCLPGPGGTWVLPYMDWTETSSAFWSLYQDERTWNEWWAVVQ